MAQLAHGSSRRPPSGCPWAFPCRQGDPPAKVLLLLRQKGSRRLKAV
jgi:hypothetical protein